MKRSPVPSAPVAVYQRGGEPYRAADPWITAAQAATGLRLTMKTFTAEVQAGELPVPYYMAPGQPVWRLSDLVRADAERGGHGAYLLTRLPLGEDGQRMLPPEVVETS